METTVRKIIATVVFDLDSLRFSKKIDGLSIFMAK